MRIVADENIPGLAEWCGGFGDIEAVDGRTLHAGQLRNADILLVRSVTRVNAALLHDTPVRFVGTATAGIDHVDTAYLDMRGIRFASAPGCNAVAVAEYVLACCLLRADALGRPVAGLVVGIIGHGHVGQAVERLLRVVGVACLRHDPPRAEAGDPGPWDTLRETLAADIVTLHVPLSLDGPHATQRLIGAAEVARMRPDALLINAARGGVLDEAAWLAEAGPRTLALDCWCGEPLVTPAVLDRCWLASPHVAGHTVDARWRATGMLADALASAYGLPPPGASATGLPRAGLAIDDVSVADFVSTAVFRCCDPRGWTTALKQTTPLPTATRGAAFDALRKRCGVRREFSTHDLPARGLPADVRDTLSALGFDGGTGAEPAA